MTINENQIKTIKNTKIQVLYGPKQEDPRKEEVFDKRSEKSASAFFKEKEAQGLYVDAYEIEVTTTEKKRKLSK